MTSSLPRFSFHSIFVLISIHLRYTYSEQWTPLAQSAGWLVWLNDSIYYRQRPLSVFSVHSHMSFVVVVVLAYQAKRNEAKQSQASHSQNVRYAFNYTFEYSHLRVVSTIFFNKMLVIIPFMLYLSVGFSKRAQKKALKINDVLMKTSSFFGTCHLLELPQSMM